MWCWGSEQYKITRILSLNNVIISFKITSGRKPQSAVWNYFKYDSVIDKSGCNLCEKKLSGTNSTNLKTHLQPSHPDASKIVEKIDGNNSNIVASPDSEHSGVSEQKRLHVTIVRMFAKTISAKICWQDQSVEYNARINALINLFTIGRFPLRLVDQPEFWQFYAILDPKFTLPRMYILYSSFSSSL